MPWVNEIQFADNEIDTVQEWNQEWDIRREWNEIYFISFTVADQDASRQLSRIHDVDGSYQSSMSWRCYITCTKWSPPLDYSSYWQMGFWHFQNLYQEKPCPHPSTPVWTNSPLWVFFHPCFGILTFLFLLLFTDFSPNCSTIQTFPPSGSSLHTSTSPLNMDLYVSLPCFLPLAPHIAHYVTSSHSKPFPFFLPFLLSFFIYRNIAIPWVETHRNWAHAMPDFWFFRLFLSHPSQNCLCKHPLAQASLVKFKLTLLKSNESWPGLILHAYNHSHHVRWHATKSHCSTY